jgi:tetratricopeptide (TPR) repeat protein
VTLEIAWHWLRGGDGERALPFAHEGAEAFLAVGAPHEGEEILKALVASGHGAHAKRQTQFLLAKALLEQSKAEEALPVVELLSGAEGMTRPERAELARMRASVEFSLSREPGDSYVEFAKNALKLAQETEQPSLIIRALFECARAGTEAGLMDLVLTAQTGLKELGDLTDVNASLMANFTKGFCDLFLREPAKALIGFHEAARLGAADRANKAFLSFAYSGIGISHLYLCQLAEARRAFLYALDEAKRVGDDARVCTMATNLCAVANGLGAYDEAIRFGQMSAAWAATTPRSSVLGGTFTNLVDAYLLAGREHEALQCVETAERLLGSRYRWRDRCTLATARAVLALIQGNLNLALDMIGNLESLARGREDAFPLLGSLWKLVLFRSAHLASPDEALASASSIAADLRTRCPFDYLDVLAVKAWLERLVFGRQTEGTDSDLALFQTLHVPGKRALLVAQGFLQ